MQYDWGERIFSEKFLLVLILIIDNKIIDYKTIKENI